MRVVLDNREARVVEATPEELRWLDFFLTVSNPRAAWEQNAPAAFRELDLERKTFPGGYLWSVLSEARRSSGPRQLELLTGEPSEPRVLMEVRDARRPPVDPDASADLRWLDSHPAVVGPVAHLREAFNACLRRTRGIVKIPTGGGKTEVQVALARALPCRWLILVPQADLLRQTAERYALRTGRADVGIVGDGEWRPERVTVATLQTLSRRLKDGDLAAGELLLGAGGLMVDECHVLPADDFTPVAKAAANAYWRLGFSGTPLDRTDRRSAVAVGELGPLIYNVRARALIRLGILSEPLIRFVPVVQRTGASTFRGVYSDLIVRSALRNAALAAMTAYASKPALVFVAKEAHGRALLKHLERVGVKASLVWGAHGTGSRRGSLDRLLRGDLDAIVCTAVFQQGVDLPGLRSVVNAAAGASAIPTLQRLGRGSRVISGSKTTFQLWDVLDRGQEWLERHAEERMRAYGAEGYLHSVDSALSPPGSESWASISALADVREDRKATEAAAEELAGAVPRKRF